DFSFLYPILSCLFLHLGKAPSWFLASSSWCSIDSCFSQTLQGSRAFLRPWTAPHPQDWRSGWSACFSCPLIHPNLFLLLLPSCLPFLSHCRPSSMLLPSWIFSLSLPATHGHLC